LHFYPICVLKDLRFLFKQEAFEKNRIALATFTVKNAMHILFLFLLFLK